MVVRAASPATSEQEFDISANLVPENTNEVITSGKKLRRKEHRNLNVDDFDAFKSDASVEDDGDAAFIAAQQAASNRKSTIGNSASLSTKKRGSFQSMGLDPAVLKAITRKGFSLPTPIQRKTIPVILENKDVVGMARTGSGKTAAFIIPMIQKLKSHSAQVGARAIILSPSRELALQTLKATKDFGRGGDLRSVLLVGGDSLEAQFSQMTSNPDIIIATPGRFLHLIVEMSLDLSSVRYVVFDEADRLFEMGFASQLTEILHALPASRQTLLFSATLPKSLVEFAKAGLREPELIRLDAESKISPNLQSVFLHVKASEKEGALLHILHDLIKVPPREGSSDINYTESNLKHGSSPHSTIVFAATKHHVEYLGALLSHAGFAVSYLYSSLDQTARQIQADNFRKGVTDILVVTDVAARGIDIPLLANVINYDFPPQSKVFVHRVGRTARAGSSGWSYNLVQTSDVPYLLDLQLFLAMPLKLGREQKSTTSDFTNEIALGIIPRHKLEKHCERVTTYIADEEPLSTLQSVAAKGTKLYIRTRNSASAESAKRSKNITRNNSLQEPHPIYEDELGTMDVARDEMLARISGFRPPETIFEFKNKQSTVAEVSSMMRKRKAEQDLRSEQRTQIDKSKDDINSLKPLDDEATFSEQEVALSREDDIDMHSASEDELEVVFGSSKAVQAHGLDDSWQDSEHYMSYEPKNTNLAEDRGYGVHSGTTSNFTAAARDVTMELTNDESKSFAEPSRLRWDKRSKKYVSRANDEDGSKGRKTIKGESGQRIAASFRSGRFDEWKKANRLGRLPKTGEVENPSQSRPKLSAKRYQHNTTRQPKQPDKFRDDYYKKKKKLASKENGIAASNAVGNKRSEIKSVDDIQKQRKVKQNRREKNARPSRKGKSLG